MIREVLGPDVGRAREFLERHVETSLFLLANLAAHGPRLGDSLNSGNFRLFEEDGRVVAVFCLAKRGILLAQTGGRADLADDILRACEGEPLKIDAVVGEWGISEALWERLRARPGFQPQQASKETLFSLDLPYAGPRPVDDARFRNLTAEDFAPWDRLNRAYLLGEGLPIHGTDEQRRAHFDVQTTAGHWWGAFGGPRMLAMVALNAVYGRVGQVGGVYTPPELRRQGLSRAGMLTLMDDAHRRHHLERLILFTGESNVAAQGLYRSLGFKEIGHFGLFFGSWGANPGPDG